MASAPIRSLVTGGAGFLGSHLCDSLVASGHSVVCIDNLFTGHRSNIRHLETSGSFRFVELDVVEPYDFDVDLIWNLACPAAPGHYRFDPIKTLRTSVDGTRNALELARRSGAIMFQASTSEVYGDPSAHPQSESYRGNVNPIGPRACYDEGKRAAETLCFDFRRQYGTKIKVVRIFNTYGPRMHPYDGRVVSNFIVQALRGEALTLYGGGTQTRAFCYVDDMIRGFRLMAESGPEVTGPINLGNPEEFSVRELANIVLSKFGRSVPLSIVGLPEDDPVRRKPDIQLATRVLGWSPRVDLEDGVERTIEWFRSVSLTDYKPPTPNVIQPEGRS